MILKPKTYRDKKYLDWIRTQKDVVYGRSPSEPHHVGTHGMGKKTNDYETIPLAHEVHTRIKDVGWGPEKVEKAYQIDMKLEVIKHLMKYIDKTFNINAKQEAIDFLIERLVQLKGERHVK